MIHAFVNNNDSTLLNNINNVTSGTITHWPRGSVKVAIASKRCESPQHSVVEGPALLTVRMPSFGCQPYIKRITLYSRAHNIGIIA